MEPMLYINVESREQTNGTMKPEQNFFYSDKDRIFGLIDFFVNKEGRVYAGLSTMDCIPVVKDGYSISSPYAYKLKRAFIDTQNGVEARSVRTRVPDRNFLLRMGRFNHRNIKLGRYVLDAPGDYRNGMTVLVCAYEENIIDCSGTFLYTDRLIVVHPNRFDRISNTIEFDCTDQYAKNLSRIMGLICEVPFVSRMQ